MITPSRPLRLLGAVACLASVALAGEPQTTVVQPLLQEGDGVTGVGLVTRIDNLAVNDAGNWTVEADTDNADTDADSVVVRDGSLYLREGDALAMPAGASIDSFDTLDLDDAGQSGWNLFLSGTSGFNDDSGVYLDTSLLIQEGDATTASDFTAGTPWIGFFECKLNDADQMLVMGSLDDPAIASSVDRGLVLLQLDGSGNLLSQTTVAKEGDLLPGQTEALADMGTNPHEFAFNDAGQSLFVADLEGDTATDMAVYLDGSLLAQEGSPSPVAGRDWLSLSSTKVGLNDAGSWVMTGRLDGDTGTDNVLVVDGQVLAQEGVTAVNVEPAGALVSSFGFGPVQIGNNGNVLWYVDTDDPDTTRDEALMFNDRVLVQEGVTTVGGVAIDTLRGTQDGYALSPDGQTVIFEAVLANGIEGAYLVDVGPWVSLGHGKPGTGGKQPILVGTGTFTAGAATTLSLTNGQPFGTAALILGLSAIDAPFKGGVLVPAPDFIAFGIPLDGSGAFFLAFNLPSPLAAGVPLFFQYWLPDPGALFNFSASNGVVATTQ